MGEFQGGMRGSTILVLDEVHAASLSMELLFQQLPTILHTTDKPLQLLLMSATLDVPRFKHIFPTGTVYDISGDTPFRINTHFCDAKGDRPKLAMDVIDGIYKGRWKLPGNFKGNEGFLIFVSGKDEGRKCLQQFKKRFPQFRNEVWFIHAELPLSEIEPLAAKPGRKFIISTDITANGITIEGTPYVTHKVPVMDAEFRDTILPDGRRAIGKT